MRKVYRDKYNSDYWEDRWSKAGVDEDGFKNIDIYPIKYAEMAVKNGAKVLEAGCGAGRVYFHYAKQGYDINGIEYSKNAVENILKKDPDAKVIEGSVADMPYDNSAFDVIVAFGLYHNIENETLLQQSFDESMRVLKSGGKLVASVRFDSLENNLTENIVRNRNKNKAFDQFHRWHFNLEDIKGFLGDNVDIEDVIYARNVSFLFKFDMFRKKELKSGTFSEAQARSSGFELNFLGTLLDKMLHKCFPKQFSNLLVFIARKK